MHLKFKNNTKMKDYVLIFRNSHNPNAVPSPGQMQQVLTSWMDWMGRIAAQNKLADRGNRLSMSEAKVVGPGKSVSDGPYAEVKEFLNGYIIVRTATIADAVALAQACPILTIGGKVEIRAVVTPNDNS